MENFRKLYKILMNESEEDTELQQTEQEINSSDQNETEADVGVPSEIEAKANQILGAMASKGISNFSKKEIIDVLMADYEESPVEVEDLPDVSQQSQLPEVEDVQDIQEPLKIAQQQQAEESEA
jgi:hypothetical protein